MYSKQMTKTIKFHYVLSDSPHDTVLIKHADGLMNYYEVNSHQWALSNYVDEVLCARASGGGARSLLQGQLQSY